MGTWQIMGDIATWVTGIATIALFIIGFSKSVMSASLE